MTGTCAQLDLWTTAWFPATPDSYSVDLFWQTARQKNYTHQFTGQDRQIYGVVYVWAIFTFFFLNDLLNWSSSCKRQGFPQVVKLIEIRAPTSLEGNFVVCDARCEPLISSGDTYDKPKHLLSLVMETGYNIVPRWAQPVPIDKLKISYASVGAFALR